MATYEPVYVVQADLIASSETNQQGSTPSIASSSGTFSRDCEWPGTESSGRNSGIGDIVSLRARRRFGVESFRGGVAVGSSTGSGASVGAKTGLFGAVPPSGSPNGGMSRS